MIWKLRRRPLFLLILGAILLAACGGAELVQTEAPSPIVASPTLPPAVTQAPTEPAQDAAPSPTAADTGQFELGFSMGDPNLKATDPATVSLESGDIQLVEFFAFW